MTSNQFKDLLNEDVYNKICNDIYKYDNIFYRGETLEEKYLPTGLQELDEMLKGGLKKGSLTEISGATNTGKTLLALMAIKNAQKEEKISIFIDASRKFNLNCLKENGIDEDSVFIILPDSAEKLGILLSEIIPPISENIGTIILDDLPNLSTNFEKKSSIKKNTDIHKSKVIKGLLMRINNLIKNTEICALILNQKRNNFLENGQVEQISSFEKLIKMSCDTRINLFIDEEEDICVDVKFKEKKIK